MNKLQVLNFIIEVVVTDRFHCTCNGVLVHVFSKFTHAEWEQNMQVKPVNNTTCLQFKISGWESYLHKYISRDN